ncbi:MAG: hypothetical protein M1142_01625 [Patescibacteria group bacterium]|nr:hypothetical protein [Patescibacteria group bacterium]
MNQEVDVRFSYLNLACQQRPDIALFGSNRRFIEFAQKTGFSSVEYAPFWGPALDVLFKRKQTLAKLTAIKSGHVMFNPYAQLAKVLRERVDPLRPDEKLAKYNLAFPGPALSIRSLHKLEKVFGSDFPVVTYNYRVGGQEPYGHYKYPLIQTHPAVFGDESNADVYIKNHRLAVFDFHHALEEAREGVRPFGDWKTALAKMLQAGIIKEVHVQVGRVVHADQTIPSIRWLKEMTGENPNYNNEIGQMIRMVKSADPAIPFVLEASLDGLVAAGLVPANRSATLLAASLKVYPQLADYIRRA